MSGFSYSTISVDDQVEAQKKTIDDLTAEVESLKQALSLLSANPEATSVLEIESDAMKDESEWETDVPRSVDAHEEETSATADDVSTVEHNSEDDAEEEKDEDEEDEDEDEDEDEQGRGEAEPYYDSDYNIFRCVEFDCGGEVLEGSCCFCGKPHKWNKHTYIPEGYETDINLALSSDRSLVPRGNTPLLPLLFSAPAPDEYTEEFSILNTNRTTEYHQLLKRGATRSMCETFHLHFTYQRGIFAWANQEIFDDFSGPGIQIGDRWKIYLGRRVVLDNDDEDGSVFVKALLEDAVLYPTRESERWETVELTPGIWVTRPVDKSDLTDDESDTNSDDSEGSENTEDEDEDADMDSSEFLPSPIIDIDLYEETSDGMDSEDEDEYLDDNSSEEEPGFSFRANVPDARWDSGEDDDEEEGVDGERVPEESGDVGEVEEEEDEDEDEDSDWVPEARFTDEEESEDEEVIHPAFTAF